MQADCFHGNRDPFAVNGAHSSIRSHFRRTVGGLSDLFNKGSWSAAGNQLPPRRVATIGEPFVSRGEPCLTCNANELAAGESIDFDARISVSHSRDDGFCGVVLPLGIIVESAVRLHMRKPSAQSTHDAIQRAHLIKHTGVDFVG
ncbi:hypothetical protein WI36_17815 [Burkholderia ubonensis]|nr:hypothetical protein WI36_17815 [Burkholderia ubonensis]